MKWTFIIQQKFKVALLLACIMLLIVVTNLISRKNVGDISRSFESMYNDRLIPATDIFYLAENLFNKRLLVENFLMSSSQQHTDDLREKIARHNKVVDSLIAAFEKTYLVDEESEFLSDFKEKTTRYKGIEDDIIKIAESGSRDKALKVYDDEGKEVFQCTIENLERLTQIQTTIGNDLNNASQLDAASITTLFSIQLILVFIIGAVVQALIFASKTLKSAKKQQYHLN